MSHSKLGPVLSKAKVGSMIESHGINSSRLTMALGKKEGSQPAFVKELIQSKFLELKYFLEKGLIEDL